VTADLLQTKKLVELERAESGEKTAAKVQVKIDYEANLALLERRTKHSSMESLRSNYARPPWLAIGLPHGT